MGTVESRTPLFSIHQMLGARMVEFAGWQMPLQYSGVIEEHKWVRSHAGIFDLSHMGEIRVSGTNAREFLQQCTTNDLDKLEPGKVQYSLLCNHRGGIIDDILVYRHLWGYELVVNAANRKKDLDWLRLNRPERGVVIDDVSRETALIAVQGPKSEEIVSKALNEDLSDLRYYWFITNRYQGKPLVISRTGYTGEDGFEIYVPKDAAEGLWVQLVTAGGAELKPVGLGARDTLRMEMCYCLYGNDIGEDTNPLEAGLGWVVKLDKDFIGKQAILRAEEAGITRRLVAIELPAEVEGKRTGIPRTGYTVYSGGQAVGTVTSGTFSPTLERPICLAYIKEPFTAPGTELEIEIRRSKVPGVIVKKPFVKPSVKR